jgi:hypothetical protein
MTFQQLIQQAVQEALGLPRDPIATDIRDLALATANMQGKIIWLSWPYDNEKLDEFTDTPDANGIITLPATVDIVRAVKCIAAGTTEGTRVWPESELIAAAAGETLSSDRFHYLADLEGFRRIKVGDTTASYRILALARWTDATVEADYDPASPEDTPTDYRVLQFPLDRAEPALMEFIKDALRVWDGAAPTRDGGNLLQVAMNRETKQQDRDDRLNPRCPAYDEVGAW